MMSAGVLPAKFQNSDCLFDLEHRVWKHANIQVENRCKKRRIRASERRGTSEHTYNNQHFWRKIDPVLKKRDLFVFSIFGFGFVLFLRRKTNFQAINATIWWLAGLPRWWHETLPDCRKKIKGIAEVFAIFRLREKFYQFQLYWNCECLVSNC